jgi:hypothetical protein
MDRARGENREGDAHHGRETEIDRVELVGAIPPFRSGLYSLTSTSK